MTAADDPARPSWLSEQLYPFESHYAEPDGARVHYVDEGSGPTRQPHRFARFVIGNTWAWPKSDPGTQLFSRLLGGPIGRYLILQRNFFVEQIIPRGVKRRKLPKAVMDAYRGPFPSPESRRPVHIFPGASTEQLTGRAGGRSIIQLD
jgi:hypothetical protein